MRFKFEIEIEVERTEGKFATRDEIQEQLQDELISADPGNLEGSEGGQYETREWSVNAVEIPKPPRKAKPSPANQHDKPGTSPEGVTL